MACDRSRERVFGAVLGPRIQAALGAGVPAEEVLGLVYDVAVSQPPPEDKVDQLAARAAYQKLKALAAAAGIDLYPHQSASGLPAPEAVAAWAQVGALLDAAEGGKPLPPLAADAHQSLAFHGLTRPEAVVTPWNQPMTWATRMGLRHGYASNPALLAATLTDVGQPVGAEHDPILSEMAAVLAADRNAPPDLAAAARQYLALVEAEALDERERGAWARVMARAVGLGIGREPDEYLATCLRCGEVVTRGSGHRCSAEDQQMARELVVAAAQVMADPLDDRTPPDIPPTPRLLAQALVAPLVRTGATPDLHSPDAAMLDLLRAGDRRRVAQLVADPRFPKMVSHTDAVWVYEATRRAPIQFNRGPCIWEDGYLYPEEVFRAQANWGADSQRGERIVADTAKALCQVNIVDLIRVMNGEEVPTSKLRFTDVGKLACFGRSVRRADKLVPGDIITSPACGCIYVCEARDGAYMRTSRMAVAPGGCRAGHGDTSRLPSSSVMFEVVSTRMPQFPTPSWPHQQPLTLLGVRYGM